MARGPDKPPGRAPPQTVFQPRSRAAASDASVEDSWLAGGSTPPTGDKGGNAAGAPAGPGAARSRTTTGRIPIGSLLNHIYEVRRFISRGGMGETYEGVNVNTDERVAIKVILEHLAEDARAQALFRTEALVLTRISHDALVKYRLMAREPTLGLAYIVLEFVDGVSLEERIGQIRLSERELRALFRRLAEGLAAAHAMNVYHRDISPDNILLPEGRLDLAKIIDFGIAKDVQTSQATIVGTGFAGKLNFVAPEQFGDFGREIGPWTDIYSLALVMLSVAAGRQVDMGTTLVEAVDKRRAGPDLSFVPDSMRPLFARMLAADPAHRLRNMGQVIAELDRLDEADSDAPARESPRAPVAEPPRMPSAIMPPRPTAPPVRSPPRSRQPPPPPAGGMPRGAWAMAAGAAAVVLALGVVVILFMGKKGPPGAPAASPPAPAGITAVVNQATAAAACSWMTYSGTPDPARPGQWSSISFSGAAGDRDAAFKSVGDAVQQQDPLVSVSSDIHQLGSQRACEAIDAFRAVRDPDFSSSSWFAAPVFRNSTGANPECGKNADQALVNIAGDLGRGPDAGDDVALMVMSPDGDVRSVFNGESGLRDLSQQIGLGKATGTASTTSGRGFSVGVCESQPGLYGVILVRGTPPFALGLSPAGAPDAGPMPADFPARFTAMAQQSHWRTQMGWFQVERGAPPSEVVASANAVPEIDTGPPPIVSESLPRPEHVRTPRRTHEAIQKPPETPRIKPVDIDGDAMEAH